LWDEELNKCIRKCSASWDIPFFHTWKTSAGGLVGFLRAQHIRKTEFLYSLHTQYQAGNLSGALSASSSAGFRKTKEILDQASKYYVIEKYSAE
jgi:hypothetical protein